MGNIDQTANKQFMNNHQNFVKAFKSDKPLFNVQDIKFPLSTSGTKIVDATGRRVKLAGGNWSGGHMCRHCVDGLECRPLRDLAMDIRYKFKMNCIRLTYSMQLFYSNNVVPDKYLKANPELIGKKAMQIFDITVQTLTDVGLMVILNNHTSTSQWCCSDDDGDGLWWSQEFPQYKFFQSSEKFAERYRNNPRVIGMDLRNQIRKANGLSPTWGQGSPLTDWRRAANICAQKVLKIAPHWLILIGGLNYQLDLTGVQKYPIYLSVPNKLVYTGHFYGFSWPIPSWSLVSYEDFQKKLFNSQTFIRGLGYPYFLGQYGNNQQDIPWKYLIKYLKKTDIDWTYWALDGFKCDPQKDETYGVFTNDFKNARNPALLQDMKSVGPPQGTVIQPPKIQYQPKSNIPINNKPQVVQIQNPQYYVYKPPTQGQSNRIEATKKIQNTPIDPKNFGPQQGLKLTIKPTIAKQVPSQIPEKVDNQQVPSSNLKYIGPQYVQNPQYNFQQPSQQPGNRFAVQAPQQPQQQIQPQQQPQQYPTYPVNSPPPTGQYNQFTANQPVINQRGNSLNTTQNNPYIQKK